MQIKTTMRSHLTPVRMAIIKNKTNRAEARRTKIPQPVEHKPHSQKDRQDEKTTLRMGENIHKRINGQRINLQNI